jgi:hypothetical protein
VTEGAVPARSYKTDSTLLAKRVAAAFSGPIKQAKAKRGASALSFLNHNGTATSGNIGDTRGRGVALFAIRPAAPLPLSQGVDAVVDHSEADHAPLLSRAFFENKAQVVAPALIGTYLLQRLTACARVG